MLYERHVSFPTLLKLVGVIGSTLLLAIFMDLEKKLDLEIFDKSFDFTIKQMYFRIHDGWVYYKLDRYSCSNIGCKARKDEWFCLEICFSGHNCESVEEAGMWSLAQQVDEEDVEIERSQCSRNIAWIEQSEQGVGGSLDWSGLGRKVILHSIS